MAHSRSYTVASKCGFDVFGPQRRVTNSAAHIKEYIEGTINRLGFTPDLYYLHRIDPSTSKPPTQTPSEFLTLRSKILPLKSPLAP
jgi:aryl-alcohol dehydrogenase-like predicted oxidoreductase